MFSQVMLGTNNIERAKQFYDAIMKVLGYNEGTIDAKGRCRYFSPTGIFALTKPIDGKAATFGNGTTIGFLADNSDIVDEWHRAGVAHGGTSIENPPGIRESNGRKLYLAYLRDPDGNKICATYFVKKTH